LRRTSRTRCRRADSATSCPKAVRRICRSRSVWHAITASIPRATATSIRRASCCSAYGRFEPKLDLWIGANGRYVDPFRPQIEPNGFDTPKALREDRARHLAEVRRMFEELDIFVFTFGLTES
jgi:hypothetical protein